MKRFLEKNEYDYIITNKELLNPTSELVYNSKGATDFNRNLANILHTPYTDHDAWMCWPVYREAILFYNERDALIDGLNGSKLICMGKIFIFDLIYYIS